VRCSPHTFRHTFAILFLRGGGNQFTLMQLLRHTNLAMTYRYVYLAQADVENENRQFSAVEKRNRFGAHSGEHTKSVLLRHASALAKVLTL
jgi:integrase